MGISGLKQLIRKNAPDAIKPFYFELLRGKTVVIDSSILLYKFRYIYTTDDFHIRGFKEKIKEFELAGIHPIFVFDGKPPEAKKAVLNVRKENRIKMKDRLDSLTNEFEKLGVEPNFDEHIDDSSDSETEEHVKAKKIYTEIKKIKKNLLYVHKNHSVEVMKMLKDLGISFFESYGEAEEACAYFQKKGYAEYILTEDTDSLAFGGSNVLVHAKNGYEIILLEKILESLELEFSEFIDLCILCGCDYTCKIRLVGPTAALKIIKEHRTLEHFIEHQTKWTIPDSFDYNLARNLFLQNNSFDF